MSTLTTNIINELQNELNTIVNNPSNIVEVWDKDDVYQFIDDECNKLLVGFIGCGYEIDEHELFNDFCNVRRDAQEDLADRNGMV